MASDAVQAMQKTITSCMVQRIKIEASKNRAQSAVVRGGSVTIGNKSYSAIPVVDVYYTDGDNVWAIPDESSSRAIIVGN